MGKSVTKQLAKEDPKQQRKSQKAWRGALNTASIVWVIAALVVALLLGFYWVGSSGGRAQREPPSLELRKLLRCADVCDRGASARDEGMAVELARRPGREK